MKTVVVEVAIFLSACMCCAHVTHSFDLISPSDKYCMPRIVCNWHQRLNVDDVFPESNFIQLIK